MRGNFRSTACVATVNNGSYCLSHFYRVITNINHQFSSEFTKKNVGGNLNFLRGTELYQFVTQVVFQVPIEKIKCSNNFFRYCPEKPDFGSIKFFVNFGGELRFRPFLRILPVCSHCQLYSKVSIKLQK